MSGRPAGRTAFEGLRPTIIREPRRSEVPLEAEARLLDKGESDRQFIQAEASSSDAVVSIPPNVQTGSLTFTSATLLSKKRRDILIPVTFRMPQSLKNRLEKTAKEREINQTDLINEAIELNLNRYV